MIIYENKQDTFFAEQRSTFYVEPHLHHHMELLYLTEGTLEATIDDTVYRAGPGDAVVVFPNQIHSFRDEKPIHGYIIIAPPDNFPELETLFKRSLPVCPLIHPATDEIGQLFARIAHHSAEGATYCREIQRGYTLALLSLLIPLLELYPHNSFNLTTAQKVLLYCDEHYTEPLSLESLSHQFGVSRFYISHVFSDKIKINFHTYLHMLRIQAAKQLLCRQHCAVTEVAYLTGYNSIRSFNRRFYAAVGCTPTEYRQAHTGAQ